MNLWKDVHVKVKASAIAGVVATTLTALASTAGAGEPPWVAALFTLLAAVVAGYATPTKETP